MSQSVLCPVLIGRASERARLEGRLRQAAEGTGRAVPVTGDAVTMPTHYRRLRSGRLRLAELLRERDAAAAASPV